MSLLKKLKECKYVEKEFNGVKVFIKLLSVKEFTRFANFAEDEEQAETKRLVSDYLFDENKQPALTIADIEELDFKTFTELSELVISCQVPDDKKKANQK